MAKLGVNIDHVATVRQARRTDEPDPVWAATEAQLGGADCITFHLREDRRHIVDRDVRLLREVVNVKLNMEMSVHTGIVRIACHTKPTQCTLVPERREEVTTEGGLDVIRFRSRIKSAVKKLHDAGAIVSAFIEPIPDHIRASADAGCDAVELWTGSYANARSAAAEGKALQTLREGVAVGMQCGLTVHGGHGLTYRNVDKIAAMPGFEEFNIGHSIIARAIFVGLREAVRQMKQLLVLHAPKEA
ncbi:MAG TPA: pyridoxine 5'-phosphate synthase [Phycisphaerae bacterium]|nr:pyridoxine 5'-phosphate synthase [Phycisphaerae bacterium]